MSQVDPNAAPPPVSTPQTGGNTFLGQPAIPVGTITGGGYTWSGAAPQSTSDFSAMVSAANTARGGPMANADPAYWASVWPEFQARYGTNAANELYQRMLGKEAGGADAAPAGPYSAASGYAYSPTPTAAPVMAAPAPLPTIAGANSTAAGTDTSWMNSTPPAPGWVAVPGVGWVPPDNPAAQAYTAQQAAATPSTAATDPNSSANIDESYRAAIMNLLSTPQTVDAASLQSDPSVAAYRNSMSRSADTQRAQSIEQAIQGGTYSSSPDVTGELARGIDQKAAESTANFTGTVALNKMQQNRDALVAGIQAAQSAGQFDKAQALQKQLADLQASIQQAQIAQTGTIAAGQLSLAQQEAAAQQQQFLDSLGYNYSALGANLNQSAVLALLNGVGG
jgi:hypothetical protein